MSDEKISVTRSVTLKAPILEVWAVVGDFHGLDKWHPAVTASTREHVGDEEFRALTLGDGGRIIEHLESSGTHAYRYAILRGPLPVKHYHALIEATALADGTRVTWSSTFTPTAPDAAGVIEGVYDAGLAALAERFGS